MEQSTREIGEKTSSMVMGRKRGLMVQVMKEIMWMGRSMVLAGSLGLMEALTMDNSSTIILMVKAYISGQMADSMREIGRTTKWRAKGFSHGQTTGSMRVTISMIRRKGWASSTGLMVGGTKESGKMANNMEKESIRRPVGSRGKENGTMGKELNGCNDAFR